MIIMIRRLILAPFRPSSHFSTLSYFARSPFSAEQQADSQPEFDNASDRAAIFYRNAVRRINIDSKGRGKFTESHLLRMIKLTQNVKQTPMLFEAYYNLLGHFTVMSNSTVDKLMLKVLSFEQFPLDAVLETFQNHNYLAYYPGYAVTKRLLVLNQNDQAGLAKVLLMLSWCPLVKLDKDITQYLMDLLRKQTLPQKIFSTNIKLLVLRQQLNILGVKLTNLQLLNFIAERIIERYEKVGVFSVLPSDSMLSLLKEIAQKQQNSQNVHFQLALVSLAFGAKEILYQCLNVLEDHQKQTQLFGYFKLVNPLFINQATEYFHTLPLTEQLKANLEALRPQQ